ncbi:hypothetical protein C8F01DRAFT_1368706 [Mycena amicta]|nr:hypothetical protein C8F01DRAFT_1368706 [Mycena amicta]
MQRYPSVVYLTTERMVYASSVWRLESAEHGSHPSLIVAALSVVHLTSGMANDAKSKAVAFFVRLGPVEDDNGKAKGYSLNVPLDDGITDESHWSVFDAVIARITGVIRRNTIVLLSGDATLLGDKLGGFKLFLSGHAVRPIHPQIRPPSSSSSSTGGCTIKIFTSFRDRLCPGSEHDASEELPWCEYFEGFGLRHYLDVVKSNARFSPPKSFMETEDREPALEQLQELSSWSVSRVTVQDVSTQTLGAL